MYTALLSLFPKFKSHATFGVCCFDIIELMLMALPATYALAIMVLATVILLLKIPIFISCQYNYNMPIAGFLLNRPKMILGVFCFGSISTIASCIVKLMSCSSLLEIGIVLAVYAFITISDWKETKEAMARAGYKFE